MYFTSLPDHTQPGFDENLHFSKFKKHNIIFNALSSKSACDDHVGCLSLKTVLSGEEWYGINRRHLAVRPGQFLLLNDDQNYSCRIDTSEKVQCLSVFFKNDFASAVFRDMRYKEDHLLDNPLANEEEPLEFFQTLNPIEPELQLQLSNLISSLDKEGYNSAMVDEQLVFLLQGLIEGQKLELKRADKVKAVKASTKRELYKRLCIAKDVLHSSYMENTDLNKLSEEACLSVPQLVRQFKSVFHLTPHQYLIQIRLKKAAELLKHSNYTVSEITWLCGFENSSAFCRSFKHTYGLQPINFRNANS